MKVLAFAASSSRHSINKQLVSHAADVLRSKIHREADVEFIDLNDYEMPIYSVDRELEGGIPDAAQRFYKKIGDADALLISYAEHNGHYTAAFKNTFDWASRIDMRVYQDKPMVIMSASPGPGGGASVLNAAKSSAPFFGADIKGSISVGPFSEKFESDSGQLSDPELSSTLQHSLKALAQ